MSEEIEIKKARQGVAAEMEVTTLRKSMSEQQKKKEEKIEEDQTPMIFEESKEVEQKQVKKPLTPTDGEGDK